MRKTASQIAHDILCKLARTQLPSMFNMGGSRRLPNTHVTPVGGSLGRYGMSDPETKANAAIPIPTSTDAGVWDQSKKNRYSSSAFGNRNPYADDADVKSPRMKPKNNIAAHPAARARSPKSNVTPAGLPTQVAAPSAGMLARGNAPPPMAKGPRGYQSTGEAPARAMTPPNPAAVSSSAPAAAPKGMLAPGGFSRMPAPKPAPEENWDIPNNTTVVPANQRGVQNYAGSPHMLGDRWETPQEFGQRDTEGFLSAQKDQQRIRAMAARMRAERDPDRLVP